MNDYETLAQRISEVRLTLEGITADDEDIAKLLADGYDKLTKAEELGWDRA